MKARLNTDKVIHFLDLASEVGAGPFVVETATAIFVNSVSGEASNTLAMTAVANEPVLHGSSKFYVKTAGVYELLYKTNGQVFYIDTLEVGLDPVSDVSSGVDVDVILDAGFAGGVAEDIKVRVYDNAGKSHGPETYATFTGSVDVTSTNVLDAEKLVVASNGQAGVDVVFNAAAATVTGAAATFAAGAAADIAKYTANGEIARDLTLDGTVNSLTSFVAILNAQLKGITASESGGQIKLTSDISGSDSSIVLSDFAGDFAVKSGLSTGTTTSNPNSVANADSVTFAELKNVIESNLLLVTATQEASTGYLVLTANKVDDADVAIAGGTTSIDLGAASDAALVTRLGLSGLGSQGGLIAAAGSDGTEYQTVYSSNKAGYLLENFSFSGEGDYFIVWLKLVGDNHSPVHGAYRLVVNPVGKENVAICLKKNEATSGDVQPGVKVILCTTLGEYVAASITDIYGYAYFGVYPGTYRVIYSKTGRVFTRNASTLVVHDTASVSSESPLSLKTATRTAQGFSLFNEYMVPTIGEAPSIAPECELFVRLFTVDNRPLPNADIYISYVGAPQVVSGYGVAGGSSVYTTDANGYVSFKLIQGAKIEAAVALMSLRRIVTVPSGDDAADPVNLLTLMADADDLFDIISSVPVSAPRRTLG